MCSASNEMTQHNLERPDVPTVTSLHNEATASHGVAVNPLSAAESMDKNDATENDGAIKRCYSRATRRRALRGASLGAISSVEMNVEFVVAWLRCEREMMVTACS